MQSLSVIFFLFIFTFFLFSLVYLFFLCIYYFYYCLLFVIVIIILFYFILISFIFIMVHLTWYSRDYHLSTYLIFDVITIDDGIYCYLSYIYIYHPSLLLMKMMHDLLSFLVLFVSFLFIIVVCFIITIISMNVFVIR